MSVSEAIRRALIAQLSPAPATYRTRWTMREVAKETGVSPSTISRFVNGGTIRSDHLDALAKWLEMGIA